MPAISNRSKRLAVWVIALLTPGLLMLVPVVNIFTLPVWILWITIPAIPLSVLGIRSFEFQEFGATPEGLADWACIVVFWIGAACVMSCVPGRSADDGSARRTNPAESLD